MLSPAVYIDGVVVVVGDGGGIVAVVGGGVVVAAVAVVDEDAIIYWRHTKLNRKDQQIRFVVSWEGSSCSEYIRDVMSSCAIHASTSTS